MASIGPYCSLLAGQSMASDVCIAGQPWCGVAVWSCVAGAAPPALLGPGQPDSSRPPTQPGPGPASVGSGPGLPTLLVTSHTILPRSDNTPLLGLGLHREHRTVIVFYTSRQIQL